MATNPEEISRDDSLARIGFFSVRDEQSCWTCFTLETSVMRRKSPGRTQSLPSKALIALRTRGILYVVRAAAIVVAYRIRLLGIRLRNTVLFPVYVAIRRTQRRTFVFQGKTYRYFYHRYNVTWRNERCVEVPIVYELLEANNGGKILEVGNVLSHYFRVQHEVVDKYERSLGVINQDIVDFHPAKTYDLILSISTFEHIGWDELYAGWDKGPRDPMKILRAIENLIGLLAEDGVMIVTFPIGYNPRLDRLLGDCRIPFHSFFCLKRISKDNSWEEVGWNDVRDAKFGSPFPNANGLIIGFFRSKRC